VTTAPLSSAALAERRKVVEEQLRALASPRPARRALPPEGRLSADERPAAGLPAALAELGPVFADFGRYLSSRIDLLPRRLCLELSDHQTGRSFEHPREPAPGSDVDVLRQLEGQPGRRFWSFDPVPRAVTAWTQQYYAMLAPNRPVTVTLVRPDADRLLETDLPLLTRVGPWVDMTPVRLGEAIDDFSRTLRLRLDQTEQAKGLIRLAEDARAGGGFDAPVCYPDFCARGILTTERIGGITAADTVNGPAVAQRLASAWLRQVLSGGVVPFDFELRDIRLDEERLVLTAAVFEPLTATGREQFLRYLMTAVADDPDAAWGWIEEGAIAGPEAESQDRLRRRLRQAVPFRDGDWSGDQRLAEQLLVQWRVAGEAGWVMRPYPLHLYRGIQIVSAATTRLAPEGDALLAALRQERTRRGLAAAQPSLDPRAVPVELNQLLQALVHVPQQLDEVLTLAASGRLRLKLHVPDAEETRRVRNRTVSLVASLVTLVAVAVFLRHLAPAYGARVEQAGAVLLLAIGGWLLVAAARL
jgi:predicted unusual protein kinase regulating ubiquinone biosynthesis (AarF/ABC1/UbiB family)